MLNIGRLFSKLSLLTFSVLSEEVIWLRVSEDDSHTTRSDLFLK